MVQKANVILVTFNYRVGSLGFLYTGITINGNYGFTDQVIHSLLVTLLINLKGSSAKMGER